MTRPIGNPASSKKSVPDTPTFTATANNANRPYNNGSVDIVFTPPAFDGKLPITSYRANSSDGQILSSATTSIQVNGLVGGSSYTFTGNALNLIGPSATTPTSAPVPVSTVPSTPTMNSGQFSATIPYGNAPQFVSGWTNSLAGGSSILRYEYSSDGSTNWRSFGVAASPGSTTVQSNGINFVPGTDYSFLIRAVNANGASIPSTTGVSYRAATVPQQPTINSVTRISNTVARIAWTAGNNGGSPLTNILVTTNPNASPSYVNTDLDGSVDVTGTYTAGQSYTFQIYATSAYGTSLPSTASAGLVVNTGVTPNFPNFATPNFPNFPNFATPNFPNFPNFATPNFPNFPNFATPNFPNFAATPNFPNFAATPNFPNFASPSCTPGAVCDNAVFIGYCAGCAPYPCYQNYCYSSTCACSRPCGLILC
jgi:hypothetical protein